MLEHYKENAGAAFRKELDIVCADMRSSSYEAALTRLRQGSIPHSYRMWSEVSSVC